MADDFALTPEMRSLAESILADGVLDGDEVLKIRRTVFPDGVVSHDEAELIFFLDANGRGKGGEWRQLYVEALTDYFVWQDVPPAVVTDAEADYLLRRVTDDGRIRGETELALLLNIVETARFCPESIPMAILGAVKEVVLSGEGLLAGPAPHRNGVIDEADVALIRRALHGAAGQGGLSVTRHEAELLFDLNDATAQAGNAPGWRELFVQAVGAHVLTPAHATLGIDHYIERERWLDSPSRGFLATLKDSFKSAVQPSQVARGIRDVLATVFGPPRHEAEIMARLEERLAAAQRAKQVDAAEAEWLAERIARDGTLHENERALLEFVRAEATRVDPRLQFVLDRFGIT